VTRGRGMMMKRRRTKTKMSTYTRASLPLLPPVSPFLALNVTFLLCTRVRNSTIVFGDMMPWSIVKLWELFTNVDP